MPSDESKTRAETQNQNLARAVPVWAPFPVVSLLLLIPVFWHRHIEAGDLGSHLYNAWLAQLIRQGQAPGLWIASQWNNVLFDSLLSGLGSAFGLRAAERISVALAVLTFFWAAFALIAVRTRRAPWTLAPLIAVIAYGWTFEMGLMNYYISLGLCFLALAAFWYLKGGARLIALVFVPVIWLAHPLGVVWLVGIAGYVLVAEALRPRYQWLLAAAAGILLFGVRIIIEGRYPVRWNPSARHFFFNGADQLALYGPRYNWLYAFAAALFVAALLADTLPGQDRNGERVWGIPLQLYAIAVIASILLPSVIDFPQFGRPVSYLTPRLTCVTAILGCWVLSSIKPRKWHTVGFALIAGLFFAFLYVDTGRLSRIEDDVDRAIATLPSGRRVVNGIWSADDSRVVIEHIVDRACIGHCFSYENYEPATRQFRIRAAPGNSIVESGQEGELAAPSKEALARALDPPVFEISLCDDGTTNVCTHQLSPEEVSQLIDGTYDP